MQPQFATIDGLQVRYAVNPKAQAPKILLLSPWPESILAYLRIWDTLASKYSLIAADLPGFGKSQGRAEVMSPHAMGDFVAKLVGW